MVITGGMNVYPKEHRYKVLPGKRFHAFVNKGVEDQDRLYFYNFKF